jgi:hypothetical protein
MSGVGANGVIVNFAPICRDRTVGHRVIATARAVNAGGVRGTDNAALFALGEASAVTPDYPD